MWSPAGPRCFSSYEIGCEEVREHSGSQQGQLQWKTLNDMFVDDHDAIKQHMKHARRK